MNNMNLIKESALVCIARGGENSKSQSVQIFNFSSPGKKSIFLDSA
eukprot:COSAG02_NODE_32399_length_517_cov_0.442584_1_plen_45_part_10